MSEDAWRKHQFDKEAEAAGKLDAERDRLRLLSVSIKNEKGELQASISYIVMEKPIPTICIVDFKVEGVLKDWNAKTVLEEFTNMLEERGKVGFYSNLYNSEQPQTKVFQHSSDWVEIPEGSDQFFYVPKKQKQDIVIDDDIAFDIHEAFSEERI